MTPEELLLLQQQQSAAQQNQAQASVDDSQRSGRVPYDQTQAKVANGVVDMPSKYNMFTSMKNEQPNPNSPRQPIVNEGQVNVSVPKKRQTSIKTTDSRPVSAASETGGAGYVNPYSDTSGMNVLQSMLTTPGQEEELRKASVANQRILAVADALRHIGNIYNTVNGAPAQQLNNPVQEEADRYQKGKALRDQANMRYYTYQQQKAAQEAKMKQIDAQIRKQEADAERNDRIADARISRYNAQNSKDEANKTYWETRARLLEEGWPLEKAIKEARKAQMEASARLTNIKADQGGYAPRRSGSGRSGGGKGMDEYTTTTETTYNYDNLGRKTGTTTRRERTVNGQKQPAKTTSKSTFSIHNGKGKEEKKGNVGRFSIHK